ncbi:hypothetical protein W97_01855 [Coniosporium apollinis CBS 100218]|uniref:Heterokaryon incompatibility domain-containing protein n=1 Tax=Coniosporium apollinis (strain CBS 100218) TaxID=1168221 RepID=R7YLZ4_CONA1|nr:uncharacterized protein W97_01855 [Coniosporium apollinis CBS 100218]EON62631.1 hypothetical protein W97_01855 [Coniosporium apollinis CBS 100218]
MSAIYKHSFLTIAASAAPGDQAGFLGERKILPGRKLKADIPCLPHRVVEMRQIHDPNARRSQTDLQENPLNARAWAFQEHLVPARFLDFCSSETTWECKRATWSEGGFEVKSIGYNSIYRKEYQQNLEDGDPDTLYQFWAYRILTEYAPLKISFEADRLSALSAVASEMQQRTGDKYLAGLWAGDLLRGLTWFSGFRSLGWLPAEYRAPSWSWASIESTRLLFDFGYDSRPEFVSKGLTAVVLEAECQPVGVSLTGRVQGGFITLRGRWCRQILHFGRESYPTSASPDESSDYYFLEGLPGTGSVELGEFRPDTTLEVRSYQAAGGMTRQYLQRSRLRHSVEAGLNINHPVYCVGIAEQTNGWCDTFTFLVLDHAEGKEDTYQRLGLAYISSTYVPSGWIKSMEVSDFTIV